MCIYIYSNKWFKQMSKTFWVKDAIGTNVAIDIVYYKTDMNSKIHTIKKIPTNTPLVIRVAAFITKKSELF